MYERLVLYSPAPAGARSSCKWMCPLQEGEQTLICPASNLNAQLPLQAGRF